MTRAKYVGVFAVVSQDEHALITAVAARESITVSDLIRGAINAMGWDVFGELVYLEPRKRGRPRKEAA